MFRFGLYSGKTAAFSLQEVTETHSYIDLLEILAEQALGIRALAVGVS